MLCTHMHTQARLGSAMSKMQIGDQPNNTLFGPGHLGALSCPAGMAQHAWGWHSMLGDSRDIATEPVEKESAFQVPCVVALSC